MSNKDSIPSVQLAEESYPPLTREQELVAYISPKINQLVLAPPGTGKTHIVVARLEYLITQWLLEPYEIAVLCFTRAAVREIIERVTQYIANANMHDDLRFVSVRTFDSFATRLLMNVDPDIDLSGKGFDDRIEMAVKMLRSPHNEEIGYIENYQHVVVDEIQDLVGIRAEFVKALLERISGGFTLLGDPAQAIYGFSNKGQSQSETLIDWVSKKKWPEGLETKELSQNHRSSENLAELANEARQLVLKADSDKQTETIMHQLLKELPELGSAGRAADVLKSSKYDRVCILCRTNGELLHLASLLAQQGVGFNIKLKADESALPAWLGRVLSEYTDVRISENIFVKRWEELVGNDEMVDPERAFHWLRIVEGSNRPNIINISELHRRLYQGYRLPDEADAGLYSAGENLSLSTIHASKGREFDHVILLEQSNKKPLLENQKSGEEARVLYVAATRAKAMLSQLSRDGIPAMMWKEECSSGNSRWLSRSKGGHLFMEIGQPRDVDPLSHVSKYLYKHGGDVTRLQNLLWDSVRPGTPLFIRKTITGKNTFFRIRFDEETRLETSELAQTSRYFLNDLKFLLKKYVGNKFKYPEYWREARVARVVTEVLPPFSENVWAPYERSGFALGVRVKGMVYITGGIK